MQPLGNALAAIEWSNVFKGLLPIISNVYLMKLSENQFYVCLKFLGIVCSIEWIIVKWCCHFSVANGSSIE